MLAKLQNGYVLYPPRKITHENRVIFNPTEELLKQLGYKDVIETEQPSSSDGFYYSPVYTEEDDQILQSWEKHEYLKTVEDIIRGVYDD